MALEPSARYPGQVDTSDPAAYPHGKAQNITVSGDGTGTPFEKDLVNDDWGFKQALLAEVSATPTGDPDEVGASQYLDAIKTLILNAKNAVSLQAAYLRSVALSQIAPHIDVGTALLQVGGAADAMLFRVVNSTETTTAKKLAVLFDAAVAGALGVSGVATFASAVNAGAALNVTGNTVLTGTLTVPKGNVTFASSGGGLADAAWTPVVSGVTGTGRATGDFTSLSGHYIRVGNTLVFTIAMVVDTTGWSGPGTVTFTPPVGTVSGNAKGTLSLDSPSIIDTFSLLQFGTGLSLNMTAGATTGAGQGIAISGSVSIT